MAAPAWQGILRAAASPLTRTAAWIRRAAAASACGCRRKLLPLHGAKVHVPLGADPSYFEIHFDQGELDGEIEIEMRSSRSLPRSRSATSSTRTNGGRAEGSPRQERGLEAEGRDRGSKVNQLHAGSPEEQQRWVGEM